MPPRVYHFWVYILSSRSRNLYIGMTNKLLTRTTQHKEHPSGTHTANYNIDRLVYFEFFQYVHHAIAREKQLKRFTSAQKIDLINKTNPTWDDLYDKLTLPTSPPQRDILKPVPSTTIPVRIPSATYTVEIAPNLLRSLGDRLTALLPANPRTFVITSPEIWSLHGQSFLTTFPTSPTLLEVPAGEQHKRLATVERLLEELAQHGADRDSVLLAFGGGVLGDMTGFLAATYMRGIRYIQVPTTALAQIDSSIGGKTGVNLAAGKNLAGAFYHPLAVYADINTLSTLPPAELRAGLQESIKAGIIRDATLFTFLEQNADAILACDPDALTRVIADSVRMKATVVANDEKESGERMLLNLGHTLGHAIEAATGYTQLLHGEAVAWGMLAAIGIAQRRALVTTEEAHRMGRVIRAYGPLKPFSANVSDLVALTAKDKKNRSGSRSFVLPVGIGNATILRDISPAELTDATEHLLQQVPTGARA